MSNLTDLIYKQIIDNTCNIKLGEVLLKELNDFWEKTKELVLSKFKEGNITEGLTNGILMAGEQLKVHFPYLAEDKNELSNDISFGGKLKKE